MRTEHIDLINKVRSDIRGSLTNTVMNKEKIEEGLHEFYKFTGRKPPKIIYTDSTYQSQLAANVLQPGKKTVPIFEKFDEQTNIEVNELKWALDAIDGQLWADIIQNLSIPIWQSMARQTTWQPTVTEVWNQITGREKSEFDVKDAIGHVAELYKGKAPSTEKGLSFFDYTEAISTSNYGWMSLFEACDRAGIYKGPTSTIIRKILEGNAGDVICTDDYVFISRRPISLNLNEENRLHGDGKAAIEFADGFALYFLNGVKVSKYLATTPAGSLDLEVFHKERNADVKAEFIRKYGIERLASLGKVVDSYKKQFTAKEIKKNKALMEEWDRLNAIINKLPSGSKEREALKREQTALGVNWYIASEYELIDMAAIHERMDRANYLKMKNLTVPGVFHMEGVENTCKTIFDAIHKGRWEEADGDQYETIAIK